MKGSSLSPSMIDYLRRLKLSFVSLASFAVRLKSYGYDDPGFSIPPNQNNRVQISVDGQDIDIGNLGVSIKRVSEESG